MQARIRAPPPPPVADVGVLRPGAAANNPLFMATAMQPEMASPAEIAAWTASFHQDGSRDYAIEDPELRLDNHAHEAAGRESVSIRKRLLDDAAQQMAFITFGQPKLEFLRDFHVSIDRLTLHTYAESLISEEAFVKFVNAMSALMFLNTETCANLKLVSPRHISRCSHKSSR